MDHLHVCYYSSNSSVISLIAMNIRYFQWSLGALCVSELWEESTEVWSACFTLSCSYCIRMDDLLILNTDQLWESINQIFFFFLRPIEKWEWHRKSDVLIMLSNVATAKFLQATVIITQMWIQLWIDSFYQQLSHLYK